MMSVLNEKFSIFSLQPLDAASDYFERRFAITAFEVLPSRTPATSGTVRADVAV